MASRSDRASGDVIASAVILVISLVVALIAAGALLTLTGFLTVSSGPTPVPEAPVASVVVSVASLLLIGMFVCGCVFTVRRIRESREGWPIALLTLIAVIGIAVIAAIVVAGSLAPPTP
jgi:uncharacterized membrane protein YhaH (DUF805 family)